MKGTCKVEGCNNSIVVKSRNLCGKHYHKWQRYRDPLHLFPKYHGMTLTPIYRTWGGMKTRCFNPRHKYYHRYGGRGITICERWLDFNNFYLDMGDRPKGTELDRENNDGNYEPGNCRWVTKKVNANNNRYENPNNTEELTSSEKANYWLPVDLYVGGAEHAVLHLSVYWQLFSP